MKRTSNGIRILQGSEGEAHGAKRFLNEINTFLDMFGLKFPL